MSGKYHIVKDESLGGIERRFVEVDRKADVGDYVHITRYDNDDVSTIGRVNETDLVCGDFYADYIQGDEILMYGWDLFVDYASGDKYVTLEPTNFVIIDGKEYRLVNRKANVGEKVIVVRKSDYGAWYDNKVGSIYEVINGKKYGFNHKKDLSVGETYVESGRNTRGMCTFISRNNYRVLELVKSPHNESDEILDILSALAVEVTELKRRLDEMQLNVIGEQFTRKTVTYEYDRR